jgi:hypothetical protein
VPPDRKITIIAAMARVLASVALSPLFISALWFAIATGAVITAAGAGALTRLRPCPCRPVWRQASRARCCTST